MTAGTKKPDTVSATLAMGALVAAASLTIRMIWARVVSSLHAGAASAPQEAGLIGRGGAHLVSRHFVHRDALAGQAFRLRRCCLPPMTPSTGMFSPGRTTKMSPFCTCSMWDGHLGTVPQQGNFVLGPASSGSSVHRWSCPGAASSILPTVIRVRLWPPTQSRTPSQQCMTSPSLPSTRARVMQTGRRCSTQSWP